MQQDILINWSPQETRVAVVENGAVQELHVERTLERGLVGNVYLGKVVRVLGNRSMSTPGADMAAADARPALGMTLLSGLRPSDGGSTEYQGEIYNRENAKTYRAILTPAEPDQLLVRAYVGIPLFGKTQVWRRPPTDQGAPQ